MGEISFMYSSMPGCEWTWQRDPDKDRHTDRQNYACGLVCIEGDGKAGLVIHIFSASAIGS